MHSYIHSVEEKRSERLGKQSIKRDAEASVALGLFAYVGFSTAQGNRKQHLLRTTPSLKGQIRGEGNGSSLP